MTLEVQGGEVLCGKFRRASDKKGLRMARASVTSGNLGCVRLELWQAHGKLVSHNSVKELSEFQV